MKRLILSAIILMFGAVDARTAPNGNEVGPVAPKDDETCLYPNPDAALKLRAGAPHPMLEGWKFYTAHEFLPKHGRKGHIEGFIPFNTRMMNRAARVDNPHRATVADGYLHMWTQEEPDSIDNGFGSKVKYTHSAFRTAPANNPEAWCCFTENMRIEVRYRRTDTKGFNNALWFMGSNGKPWPKNGEIDLVENPKKRINQRVHFTLHSEVFHAGTMGGKGSTTASTVLEDMTRWNIYWVEIHPDKIVGGVNGLQYFEHTKGANGNPDWPWNDPAGFYMIISTGISTDPKLWPGAVDPAEWDAANPPSMDVDWIRVYVNDDFKGPKAKRMYY